jgi:hypothetical protein
MVKDTVIITVLAPLTQVPPSNTPPVANAGQDITIRLPMSSLNLAGSGTDSDGFIASYQWRKVGGPSFYTIVAPSQATTAVNGLRQGIYYFELRVTDNAGGTGVDTMKVTVLAANLPPVVKAGADIVISLPQDSVHLSATATDADGTVVAYRWSMIKGPSSSLIMQPTQLQTLVKNLVPGIYQFEMAATDNLGEMGRDTITVTVNPDTRRMSTAQLYPNPADASVSVTISAVTQRNLTTITIYDLTGRIVHNEQFIRNQQVIVKTVDVSKLKPGVYILSLNADITQQVSMKFVKQ